MRFLLRHRLALLGGALSLTIPAGLALAQDGRPAVGPATTTPLPRYAPQTEAEVLPPVPATASDPAPPGTYAVPATPSAIAPVAPVAPVVPVAPASPPVAVPGTTTAPTAPSPAPAARTRAAERDRQRGIKVAEGVVTSVDQPGEDLPHERIRITVDTSQSWDEFAQHWLSGLPGAAVSEDVRDVTPVTPAAPTVVPAVPAVPAVAPVVPAVPPRTTVVEPVAPVPVPGTTVIEPAVIPRTTVVEPAAIPGEANDLDRAADRLDQAAGRLENAAEDLDQAAPPAPQPCEVAQAPDSLDETAPAEDVIPAEAAENQAEDAARDAENAAQNADESREQAQQAARDAAAAEAAANNAAADEPAPPAENSGQEAQGIPLVITMNTYITTYARSSEGQNLTAGVPGAVDVQTSPGGETVHRVDPAQRLRPTNFTNIRVGSFVAVRYRRVGDVNEALNLSIIEPPRPTTTPAPSAVPTTPGGLIETPAVTPVNPLAPAAPTLPTPVPAGPARYPTIPLEGGSPGTMPR